MTSGLSMLQVLEKYEGLRIKAHDDAKPDQFFVFKGVLHYIGPDAAEICEKRKLRLRRLDVEEEFVLSQAPRGYSYNALDMETALDETGIFAPDDDIARRDGATGKDIIRHIDEMHRDLSEKLNDLKRGQAVIYHRLGAETQRMVDVIVDGFQQQTIEQGQVQRTLDAIRRVLKHVQDTGLPLADDEVKKSLADIYDSMNSTIDLRQQLELTLPVIPFLLEYKIGIEAGVDLAVVWKELLERIQGKNG